GGGGATPPTPTPIPTLPPQGGRAHSTPLPLQGGGAGGGGPALQHPPPSQPFPLKGEGLVRYPNPLTFRQFVRIVTPLFEDIDLANTVSARKRARQNERRRLANNSARSQFRTYVKRVLL